MAFTTQVPTSSLIKQLIAAAILRRGGHHVDKDFEPTLDHWQELFKVYNRTKGANLQMGCYPCYIKVFLWNKEQQAKSGVSDLSE